MARGLADPILRASRTRSRTRRFAISPPNPSHRRTGSKPSGRSSSGGGRGPRGGGGGGKARFPRSSGAPAEELHPTADPPDIGSFLEWDLGDETQSAIQGMGISVPTPIQCLAIGAVLEGRDIIAKAETGTGKTLAFGAPMMARIDPQRASVLGLVLCPTRELAQQVHDVLALLGAPRGVKTVLIVGGDDMRPQVKALKEGAQVVVGTPGRVLDLYEQKFLSFPWTEFAVLDEADKMFEIGFLDDVKKILSYLPDERQTMLFSATYPREVLQLARDTTNEPFEIATARGTATVESIDQTFISVEDEDRPLALMRLLEQSDPEDVFLIFCQRRTEVDRLMRRLERSRFSIKALHGGYDQAARFRVMSAFRTGEVKALVATDVASRGLDVEHVSHVVNFSVPPELEEYTHRIGRTGRAGRTGEAITFVIPYERRRWAQLMDRAGWEVREVGLPGRTKRDGPEPIRRRDDDAEEAREPERRPARAERPPRAERAGGSRGSDRGAERTVDPEPPRRARRGGGERAGTESPPGGAADERRPRRGRGSAPRGERESTTPERESSAPERERSRAERETSRSRPGPAERDVPRQEQGGFGSGIAPRRGRGAPHPEGEPEGSRDSEGGGRRGRRGSQERAPKTRSAEASDPERGSGGFGAGVESNDAPERTPRRGGGRGRRA